MSRIGKQPVAIPSGVTVEAKGRSVSVKGPKGTLSLELRPEVDLKVEGTEACVELTGTGGAREARSAAVPRAAGFDAGADADAPRDEATRSRHRARSPRGWRRAASNAARDARRIERRGRTGRGGRGRARPRVRRRTGRARDMANRETDVMMRTTRVEAPACAESMLDFAQHPRAPDY